MVLLSHLPADGAFGAALEDLQPDWRAALGKATGRHYAADRRVSLEEFAARVS